MDRNQRRQAHERKRAGGFASVREVRVLGAEPRQAANEEPDVTFGDLTEADLQEIDRQYEIGKASGALQRRDDRAAADLDRAALARGWTL